MKLLRNLATTIGKKGHRPYVDRSNTGDRPQHGDRPQLRLRAPQESALAQAAHAYMAGWSEAADDPDPDNPDAAVHDTNNPATLALDDGPGYIHKFGPNRILSPSILCMLYTDSRFLPGERPVSQKKFNAALYDARTRALDRDAPSFTHRGHTFSLTE
mmetsp:Transcript_6771/g.15980  ORF Transcript_6771/g.15980 Transcript_6771/m.15980 type:complete len:158 (-) Transcript_6771:138-611(-)